MTPYLARALAIKPEMLAEVVDECEAKLISIDEGAISAELSKEPDPVKAGSEIEKKVTVDEEVEAIFDHACAKKAMNLR